MEYKTIKEMANECNVSKQKVYRYITSNALHDIPTESLPKHLQKNNTKYYDKAVQSNVFEYFCKDIKEEPQQQTTSEETHQNTSNDVLLKHIELLEKQLEIKDKQIQELHIMLNNAQQQVKQIEAPKQEKKVSFWQRFFAKQD